MSTSEAIDVRDADAVCALLNQAAALNLSHPTRRGALVEVDGEGHLIATGDLHDHAQNFHAVTRLAKLHKSEDRHVVLQETIHGEHLINGMDLSYRILTRVAELAVRHPGQVHHVLSNHELAQMNGEGILKDGVSVVEAFNEGIEHVFGNDAENVEDAIAAYIRSLPLAVRTSNGVMIAHSLPSPRAREEFDTGVLERDLTDEDLLGPTGDAYLMTWGRGLTQKWADELGDAWGVSVFVLGHQHAEMGWEEYGQSMLVINSDHAHGVAVPIDLSKQYTRDDLIDARVLLAGV